MAKKFFSDYYWTIFNQSPREVTKIYGDSDVIEALFNPSLFLEQIETPDPMLIWVQDLFKYRNILIWKRGVMQNTLTTHPQTPDQIYFVEDGKLTLRDSIEIEDVTENCKPLTVFDLETKFLEMIKLDRQNRWLFLVDDAKLIHPDFDGERIHFGAFLSLPLSPLNPLCALANRKTTNKNFAIIAPPYDLALAQTNAPVIGDLALEWLVYLATTPPEFVNALSGLGIAQWTCNPDTNQFPPSMPFEVEKPLPPPKPTP